MNKLRCVVALVTTSIITCLALTGTASAQTFSDSTFTIGAWSDELCPNVPGVLDSTYTATQDSLAPHNDALPSSSRHIVHTYDARIHVCHLKAGATLSPSTEKEIIALTFSMHQIYNTANTPAYYCIAYFPLIRQNGVYFRAKNWPATCNDVSWQQHESRLGAADFSRADMDTSASRQRPDFSCGAAPIEFGFLSANQTLGGRKISSPMSIGGNVGKWNVEVEQKEGCETQDDGTALSQTAEAICAFEVIGPGTHFDRMEGTHSIGSTPDPFKLRSYTYVDAPRFGGWKFKHDSSSKIRGTTFVTIKVLGPQNAICVGDVTFDVTYVGTMDRMVSGVGPLGGANTQYTAEINAGILGEGGWNWDNGIASVIWKSASDPERDLAETIVGSIVGAAAGFGIGAAVGPALGEVAGEVASATYEVSMVVLSTASEASSCDDQINETQRVSYPDVQFKVGHEYRIFANLESHTWGAAAGVANGFAEVDFYGEAPDDCDKGSESYKNEYKGISLSNIRVGWP